MTEQTHRQRALDFHNAGDFDQAIKEYSLHLNKTPDDFIMWSNLGALFRAHKQFNHAVTAHKRALSGKQTAQILGNASNTFYDAGLGKDAISLREKLIKLEPDIAMHYAMLAKYLRGETLYQEALDILLPAIEKFPDVAELHIQKSMAELSLGQYQEGFKSYNWRWNGDEISLPKMPMPQWDGEDLNGKTIFVHPEQGFGDTILMARYLSLLSDMDCKVILGCKKPLLRSFTNLKGVHSVVPLNGSYPTSDYWVPMMDLPLHLGTTLTNIPAPLNMNIPNDAKIRAREIINPHKGKFKIGVLWSGSITYRANHKRSFDHTKFLPIAEIENVQLFSLYKGPLVEAFHKDGSHAIIIDSASSDRDFADSTAVIEELDLVITMDSAIAHLAGSMNVPVWNLLHSEAYWLYEPFQHHSPWYPSMRLIRQKDTGDWDSVFKQLETEIKELSKEHLKNG